MIYAEAQAAGIDAAIAALRLKPIPDPCSSAHLILDDARTRFARYLKTQGIGHLNKRGGWFVPLLPETAMKDAAVEAFWRALQEWEGG